ncbi:MAG: transglutaminase family protein [Cytophagaceae bacterium]|jgi:transglutaminase-like putative cysteine protease|nr:transglutaminase family protein [Cytophagaceae bacterium]
MNEYVITYQAQNHYPEVVTEGIFDFMVLPCNDDSQVVTATEFSNSLEEQAFQFKNVYGFDVTRLRTDKKFDALDFSVKIKVRKRNAISNHTKLTASPDEDDMLSQPDFQLDHHLYLTKTTYTNITNGHRSLIPIKEKGMPISTFIHELMDHIQDLVQYQKGVTTVQTTADQVLDIKGGVCQDFTHVFLAMCRYNGIPARYVSGYLNNPHGNHDDESMHAWLEALIPGYGWVGYDAANRCKTDINYIKVAHGVDYRDCAPLKGVIKTNSLDQKTEHNVTITIQ